MTELTQDEIKILVAILDTASFRLVDASKVIPLREKLWKEIIPEKTEVVTPDNTVK